MECHSKLTSSNSTKASQALPPRPYFPFKTNWNHAMLADKSSHVKICYSLPRISKDVFTQLTCSADIPYRPNAQLVQDAVHSFLLYYKAESYEITDKIRTKKFINYTNNKNFQLFEASS